MLRTAKFDRCKRGCGCQRENARRRSISVTGRVVIASRRAVNRCASGGLDAWRTLWDAEVVLRARCELMRVYWMWRTAARQSLTLRTYRTYRELLIRPAARVRAWVVVVSFARRHRDEWPVRRTRTHRARFAINVRADLFINHEYIRSWIILAPLL